MHTMIFEDKNGGPIARREKDQAGEPRIADNQRYFALPMAVEHFGWTEQALRELYCDTFAEATLEQHETASPASTSNAPIVGPLTAAADATLRHFVYGFLDDGEFECFMHICEERGASPWTRDIIPEVEIDGLKRTVHYITTIAFLRTVAMREKDYDGQRGPFWCGEDEQWKEVWTAPILPTACRVAVMKKGSDNPTWGTVLWNELGWGQQLPEYYAQMPAYMIGICAEATSLRRAYPSAARLYLREELMGKRSAARPPRPAAPVPQPREIDHGDGRRIVYDAEPPPYEDEEQRHGSQQHGRRQPAHRN